MIDQSVASITLIRHGPPTVSMRTPVRGHEFRDFVARYEAAKIKRQAVPPLAVKRVMNRADLVFASHRPRAIHTAELLEAPVTPIIDERFREIEFPVNFPAPLRLTALTWTVLALLLWHLGYSPGCEPLKAARRRARTMAEFLDSKAQYNCGPVILVAHGGINRLIAKELRLLGWRGPRLPHCGHWGCTTYTL
jgi:broad specificity phosphatase PhoE